MYQKIIYFTKYCNSSAVSKSKSKYFNLNNMYMLSSVSYFYTIFEIFTGVVKIWEIKSVCIIFKQTNSLILAAKEENGLAVKNFLYNKDNNSIGFVLLIAIL